MSSRPTWTPTRSLRAGGFTIVELLLALAISAVIALAAATMLAGLGSATSAQHDLRRTAVKRQVAIVRLGALLRGAAMGLAVEDDHIVLWRGDLTGNGAPELSELCRIEWNAGDAEVRAFAAPDDLPAASDVTYTFESPFSALTESLAGTASFEETLTLTEVTAFEIELDSTNPADARSARLQLRIETESGEDTVIVIAHFRASPQ